MDQKVIEKVCELMARVIKLNENAKSVFYNFEFSGHTKQVDFSKRRLNGFEQIYRHYSYLDRPDLTITLEDIEVLIAAEEKAQKEGQENDLV